MRDVPFSWPGWRVIDALKRRIVFRDRRDGSIDGEAAGQHGGGVMLQLSSIAALWTSVANAKPSPKSRHQKWWEHCFVMMIAVTGGDAIFSEKMMVRL